MLNRPACKLVCLKRRWFLPRRRRSSAPRYSGGGSQKPPSWTTKHVKHFEVYSQRWIFCIFSFIALPPHGKTFFSSFLRFKHLLYLRKWGWVLQLTTPFINKNHLAMKKYSLTLISISSLSCILDMSDLLNRGILNAMRINSAGEILRFAQNLGSSLGKHQ